MQKLGSFANKARRSIGDAEQPGNGSSAELHGHQLPGHREHGDGDMKKATTLSTFPQTSRGHSYCPGANSNLDNFPNAVIKEEIPD